MVLWRPLLAMDDDAVYDNMMGFVPEFILWSWGVINCVSALLLFPSSTFKALVAPIIPKSSKTLRMLAKLMASFKYISNYIHCMHVYSHILL